MDPQVFIQLVDELADLFAYRKRMKKQQRDMKTKGVVTLSMGSYDVDKTLKVCYQFIAEQKPELALTQIIENKEYFIRQLNSFDEKDLLTEEPIQFKLFATLRKIQAAYKGWEQGSTSELADRLRGSWLFTDAELADPKLLDPRKFVYIEKAIKDGIFKLYRYKVGKGKVSRQTKFKIYPSIGISYSLEEWFSFIDKQNVEELVGDQAIVTLFLKLDYVSEHYASFVISIHQKDSIWIASDQLDFDNPRNKQTRRKPDRDKERHYETVGLPYELAFNLDKIRKTSTELLSGKDIETYEFTYNEYKKEVDAQVKKEEADVEIGHVRHITDKGREERAAILGSEAYLKKLRIPYSSTQDNSTYDDDAISFKREGRILATVSWKKNSSKYRLTVFRRAEVLKVKFTDVSAFDRMYFVGLVERFFEELEFSPPKQRILLAHQWLEQKLLGNAEFNYNDNQLEWFKAEQQEVLEEIVTAVGHEDKALIKFKYDLLVRSPEYERSWLGTASALDNLAKWSILEGEAQVIKDKLEREVRSRSEQDYTSLETSLELQVTRLLELAFNPEQARVAFKQFIRGFAMNDKEKAVYGKEKEIKNWIGHIQPKKKYEGLTYRESRDFNLFYHHADGYRWRDKHICEFCHKSQTHNGRIHFHIRHYHQLVILLGLTDRMELPMYYRSYRAHDMIPYGGNSILDNVHPYTLIEDPCSRASSNGIDIAIVMCGICYQKFKKLYTN